MELSYVVDRAYVLCFRLEACVKAKCKLLLRARRPVLAFLNTIQPP